MFLFNFNFYSSLIYKKNSTHKLDELPQIELMCNQHPHQESSPVNLSWVPPSHFPMPPTHTLREITALTSSNID